MLHSSLCIGLAIVGIVVDVTGAAPQPVIRRATDIVSIDRHGAMAQVEKSSMKSTVDRQGHATDANKTSGSGAVLDKGSSEEKAESQPKGAVVYLYGPGHVHFDEMKESLKSVCLHLEGPYPILVVHGHGLLQKDKDALSNYQKEIAPTCREPNRLLEWVKAPTHDPDMTFSLSEFQAGGKPSAWPARTVASELAAARRALASARARRQRRLPAQAHWQRDLQRRVNRQALAARRGAPVRSRRPASKAQRHGSPKGGVSLLQTGSGDYKSMIAFWLFDVFELAHARGLDYVMRLDTDSVLDSKPKEDPFVSLRKSGAVYGYRAFCYDSPGVSSEIWPLMREHVQKEKITPSFKGFNLTGDGPAPMVYTNFEVAEVAFFRRADVKKFSTSMLVGTQRFRLGDAVIRAFQLGLFADEKQVLHLDNFRYRHGCKRWWWVINKTLDCAVEEGDPFVMDWQADSERFGTPIGQCYSSRLNATRRHMEEDVGSRKRYVPKRKA